MVLGKSLMAYIHHYNIIQRIFTVLKVLCALPIYVLPTLLTTMTFLLSPYF